MQSELGGKIDDRPLLQIAAMHGAPRLPPVDILMQTPEGIVDPAVEHQFGGPFLDLFRGDAIRGKQSGL